MSLKQRLLEIVNVKQDKNGPELLQLYKFLGVKEDKENALWFLAPSFSPLKADSFVASLLQKSLMKGGFSPRAETYFTSLVGTRKTKNFHEDNGGSLFEGFPTQKLSGNVSFELDAFRKTMLRWGAMIQPRCIISFTLGRPMIRYSSVPNNIIDKLTDLCERPLYAFGQEPYEVDETLGIHYKQNTDASFGQWCVEQDIAWIDFSLDANLKTFEEVVQVEWRNFVGPSLKWLCEGLRFQPVVEEDPLAHLQVIPALEMPPEFANL